MILGLVILGVVFVLFVGAIVLWETIWDRASDWVDRRAGIDPRDRGIPNTWVNVD